MRKPLKGHQRALGAPSRTTARLVRRVWLYGPSDAGVTASRTATTAVPAGAGWVEARAVGGGGAADQANYTNGGGGAYARGGAAVSPGGSVVTVTPGQTNGGDPPDATVSVNGVVIIKAASGKSAGVANGAGGAAADCIGTTIVAGGAGGSNGGLAGGDGADADSLEIGGQYRKTTGVPRVNDGSVSPEPNAFGCGGAYTDNYVPATNVDTSWNSRYAHYGASGVVVLEFWSKKPR